MKKDLNLKKKYNYATKDFKQFKFMSENERNKILSDWNTLAQHPILLNNNTWTLFFEDMKENLFFKNYKNQKEARLNDLLYEYNEFKNKLTKSQERLQEFKDNDKIKEELKYKKSLKKEAKLEEKFLYINENNLKSLYEKQIRIAIDANNINEKYIDKIIHTCDTLFYKKEYKEIKILVCLSDNSINSKIGYSYNEEQIKLLEKLENTLKIYNKITQDDQYKSEMKFSELLITPKNIVEYNNLWSLEDVKKSNDFVNDIVYCIKNKKLSPFEAVLFVYRKLTNTFVYSSNTNKIKFEGSQCIIGAFAEKENIICSGISSYFKLIFDRLNNSNVNVKFFTLSDPIKNEGHTLNLISLKDCRYNIDGNYALNLTDDMRTINDKIGKGFANCLFNPKEIYNDTESLYILTDINSRVDEVGYDFNLNCKEEFNFYKPLKEVDFKKWLDKQRTKIKNTLSLIAESSTQITPEQIIKGFLNVLDKVEAYYDYDYIVKIINDSIANSLSISSDKSHYPWLELLDMQTIKENYTFLDNKVLNCSPNNNLNIQLAKNLINADLETMDIINEIIREEKYFNKRYYKLLDDIKKHAECVNNNNEKQC